MTRFIRTHAATFAIAFVTATVAGGSYVWAHNDPADGHVRYAHQAEVAERAKGTTVLPLTKAAPSAAAATWDEARALASEVKVFKKGPFTIYLKCWEENSDPNNVAVRAELFLRTSAEGTIFSSGDEGDSGNGVVGPSTPEGEMIVLSRTSSSGSDPGTINVTEAEYGAVWAAAGTRHIEGDFFLGTKEGSPESGNGLFGEGNKCVAGGTIHWK